jgi:3-oxoacyl-[acyl-carrier-protein] synthase II
MSRKRAVITGIGAVTPAGIGWQKTWENLLAPRSGIRKITRFDASAYRTRIAGEVADFKVAEFIPEKLADTTDRFAHFALAATHLALEDSRLALVPDSLETGIVMGCGMGGLSYFELQADVYARKGPKFIRPGSVPRIMPNAAASHMAMLWQQRGPNLTISTACSSSNHAIGLALDLIRSERCHTVLCGGTESLLSPITFGAFDTLRVMANRNEAPELACRPFDKNRDGFVMGEGAVIFVLEELEHARARKAAIYAEVAGYGACNGTYNILAPEPGGLEASQSMAAALRDARMEKDQIQYIHAHGTGTMGNDAAETLGIKATFGEQAAQLLVSSSKPVTGHLIGAAGALGVLASVLSVKTGEVPPTMNYETPDPVCDLDYVPNKSRKANINGVLANAFAFGSNNATIAIKQEDQK